MKLSAALAVRDEEQMLAPCLELLAFCDEIVVVVDSRTTDSTEAIARRHTDKVVLRDFDNFAAQKNFAIEQTSGEWVLIVDADERIPPELAAEIRRTIDGDPSYDAFVIGLRNVFMGRPMEHGGWYENATRLVRRTRARYTREIHEQLDIPASRIGRLEHDMWHFSHRSAQDNLAKTANYIKIEAPVLAAKQRPVKAPRLFYVILKELFRRLIWRRGYRDGTEGVIDALFQAFGYFSLEVEVWEQQQKPSVPERYAELDRKMLER